MGFRLPEMIVIGVVALLVFGPKRLPDMAASIGRSINAFKKGMEEFTGGNRASDVDDLTVELRRQELEALEHEIAFKKKVSHLYDMPAATTQEPEQSTVVESNAVVSEPEMVADKYSELKTVPTTREAIPTER